jgi:hypothetical protein
MHYQSQPLQKGASFEERELHASGIIAIEPDWPCLASDFFNPAGSSAHRSQTAQQHIRAGARELQANALAVLMRCCSEEGYRRLSHGVSPWRITPPSTAGEAGVTVDLPPFNDASGRSGV